MTLSIKDGRLCRDSKPVKFIRDPHTSGRFAAPPQVLVLHYGAGIQKSDIATLIKGYISAHFSLGRTGKIIQMVSADEVAWHAGDGHMSVPYHGRSLNYTAIGIEIENLGWLNRDDGKQAWREEGGNETPRVPLDACIRAAHPLRGGREYWWPVYPQGQIEALYELCQAICEAYPSITYMVGHDEVSGQKYDPGPAFEMDAWRAVFGMAGVPEREAA